MVAQVKDFKPSQAKPSGVWAEVGLPSRGQALCGAVTIGVETRIYARLAEAMESDIKLLSKYLLIPETTIHRRKKAGRFNSAESDKIVRATEVFSVAVELHEGDRKAANRWMRTPAKGLGGKAPIEMLATNVESAVVLDLIGRLEHGVFA